MLTLYVINADSGTKVNPGHQRNIQGYIGTFKKKRDTIKKMQDFLMSFSQDHFQLGVMLGIKCWYHQVSHKIAFNHGIANSYRAVWFSKHCYKYFIRFLKLVYEEGKQL